MSATPERREPRNLRAEPPYPNHETVVFALRAPEWTAHLATDLCSKEHPHITAECGEWKRLDERRANSEGEKQCLIGH